MSEINYLQVLQSMRKDRTPEQHAHLIGCNTTESLTSKYLAGQAEHGGRLWEKPMLKNLKEEVLDQINYVHVLEEQLTLVELHLLEGLNGAADPVQAMRKAFNILRYGNEEGV